MARTYKMSWEPDKRRWVKMHKGIRYRVSCDELAAMVHTAQGSYKLANAWWERKLAELTRPDPAQELINRYRKEDLLEMIQKGKAAEELLIGLGERGFGERLNRVVRQFSEETGCEPPADLPHPPPPTVYADIE